MLIAEDFFYQVDKKYQPDKVISPIDVDLVNIMIIVTNEFNVCYFNSINLFQVCK